MEGAIMKHQSPASIIARSEPSVAALSHALRHPETWPEGFEWDYRRVECCAMGLARRLWPGPRIPLLGLSQAAARRIFCDAKPSGGGFFPASRVTPSLVADLLDEEMANVAKARTAAATQSRARAWEGVQP